MILVDVVAESDHLHKISRTKPYLAIAELVWNSLDADSTRVDIVYTGNEIGTEKIIITDNGKGFSRETAETYFGRLGGSWKSSITTSEIGRQLHGKQGQGRFKAFSLGEIVCWTVTYLANGKLYQYNIKGIYSKINRFEISDEEEISEGCPGVIVEIFDLFKQFKIYDVAISLNTFPSVFVLYLSSNPGVKILFNGIELNVESQIKEESEYELTCKIVDKETEHLFTMKLLEWDTFKTKELYFCDESGFPLKKYEKQIRYIGDYGFAAYLQSSYFDMLRRNGELELAEMNEDLLPIIKESKKIVKKYFIDRYIEDQKSIIDTWKNEDVYPYREEIDENSVEGVEKKVFDILALNLNTHVEDFNEVNKIQKALQFRLLKQAIESSPSDLSSIISEVISLPKQIIDELTELLDHSELSSIISASKTITDRIKYIKGIEEIVFDTELKKHLKERSQLHKILAENSWLFGDQFHLAVNDQSLTEVLRKHRKLINEDIVIDEPVKRIDGTIGIVDLMLSKSVPKNHSDEYEYLVIELKAPKVKIGKDELNQIESYALAVANDERFNSLKVRWEFWILSNDMDDYAKAKTKQKVYPRNTIMEYSEEVHFVVKAITWSTVLAEANHRYKFVKDQLKLNIDREDGLDFLKKTYSEYVGDLIEDKSS